MSYIGRIEPFRPEPEREAMVAPATAWVMLLACAAALWPLFTLMALAYLAAHGAPGTSISFVLVGP